MGHVSVKHVVSTVTCLPTELCLAETFVKVVSEIQVILWLEWKPHKLTPCCTNYEARVGCKYHTIINAIISL